jgi:hypothetical protein
MDRSCRGQQRVTKTNTRSSVLNIATHKKIFLTPVSAAATTDRRVPPLPLSPGREREREREARRRAEREGGAGARESEEATGASGREEEERRGGGRGLLYHRPVPALVIDGGARRAHRGRASGAGAEWAGGGTHVDLALGWRREEAGACLVSGAGSEWGGGVRADLALGRRREEAGAHSFFFSAWCAVGQRRTRRSGAGGRTHRAREGNTGRPLTQLREIRSVGHVQVSTLF